MCGDQFGEFVCGYWGLKRAKEVAKDPNMNFLYILKRFIEKWDKVF